ncbi:MAG: hypothetical protein ACJAVT_001221 [Yoonia sp.]
MGYFADHILAPVSYAIAMNYVRRSYSINVTVVLAWSFSFAAFPMLPVTMFIEGLPSSISPLKWAAIAFWR